MHASYEKIALILIVSLAMFSLNAQASEIDAMYPTDIEYVLEISNTCKSTTYSSSIISAQRTCVYADSDIYTCIPNSGIDWNKLPTSSSMKNIITDAYNLFTTIHVKLNPRVWCEETKKCCVSYRDVSVDNRIKICDSLGAGIVKSSECPDNKKVFWIRTDYAFEDEDLICCKGAYTNKLAWPVPNSIRISNNGCFGDYRRGHTHAGIDIPSTGRVYAVADGVVSDIEPYDSSAAGMYVVIKHKDNNGKTFYSRYLHLASINSDIRIGKSVQAGQTIIGRAGDTGSPGQYHLHLEMRNDGSSEYSGAFNPCIYLNCNGYCAGAPSGNNPGLSFSR